LEAHDKVESQARVFIRTGTTGRLAPEDLAIACGRFIQDVSRRSLSESLALAKLFSGRVNRHGQPLRYQAARSLARVYHLNSQHSQAEVAYLRARRLAGSDRLAKARIDRSLIDLYMYLGDYTKARRRAQQALKVFTELGRGDEEAMTRVNLANLLHRQDRHVDAEREYDWAAGYFRSIKNDLAEARCLYNQANTLVQLFELDKAEKLYARAFSIYNRAGHTIDATDSHYGLAWLHMLQGRFHQALVELGKCEESYRLKSQWRGVALCELDRAEVFLSLNLMEDALVSAEGAEKWFRGRKFNYEAAKAAFFVAKAASALGSKRKAARSASRAFDGFQRERNSGFLGAVHLHLASTDQSSVGEKQSLTQARRLFDRAQLPLWQAYCDLLAGSRGDQKAMTRLDANKAVQWVPHLFAQWQVLIGDECAAEGNMVAARKRWARAANRLDRTRSQLPPVELRHGFGRDIPSPHLRLIHSEIQFDPRRAAAWLERFKTSGLWAPISPALIEDPVRGGVENSLSALADSVAGFASNLSGQAGERGVATANGRRRVDRLQRDVKRRISQLEEFRDRDPLHVDRILELIDHSSAKTIVVQFAIIGEDLVAFTHRTGNTETMVWRGGRTKLETYMRRWRFILEKEAGLQNPSKVGPDSLETKVLTEIGEWLWRPLETVRSAKRILVIPDGELANLPWQALHLDGRPLCEQHEFVISPSVRHYVKARRTVCRTNKTEVFLGNVDNLPAVEKEIAALKLHSKGPINVHSSARRCDWPEDGSYGLWHFAGHAVHRADNPFYSYLEMADGPFFAADLRLRRARVGMVTLSACRSGEQVAIPGEESTGLVRSLLEMGVRNVVAAHWPVSDISAAMWMTSFYKEYYSGRTPAEAARKSTMNVKESCESAYHWAAFSVFGAGI